MMEKRLSRLISDFLVNYDWPKMTKYPTEIDLIWSSQLQFRTKKFKIESLAESDGLGLSFKIATTKSKSKSIQPEQ